MSAMTAWDSNGAPTFLNVGVAYPDSRGVTVVIWDDSRRLFDHDPVTTYAEQSICVFGDLYLYGDFVQVEVTSPSQIEIQSPTAR